MKYLSIDIEATGLRENDLIIEFAMVPVCSQTKTIAKNLSYHSYVHCPPFADLKPNLDEWVIQNNEKLIQKANTSGIKINQLAVEIDQYFKQKKIIDYFEIPEQKVTILGKSLNAIDLPFLNRDLGWSMMRNLFNHQVLDVSSVVMALIDLGKIPAECRSGSFLAKYLSLGEVDHTALADAVQTAEIYFKLIDSRDF